MYKKFIPALTLIIFCLFEAQTAYGCSCAPAPSPRRALREAAAVFVGEVISKEVFDIKDEFGTQPIVRVRFRLSRIWKGVEGSEAVVHTSAFEPACGYTFEQGRKYLVYAYPDHWKLGVLATGICNRTRRIESAAKDLRAIGRGREP